MSRLELTPIQVTIRDRACEILKARDLTAESKLRRRLIAEVALLMARDELPPVFRIASDKRYQTLPKSVWRALARELVGDMA
jgi:hypothetical protein